MAGRALVYSDPDVIALVSREFIPVAENSSYLQTERDAKGEFFRLVVEQGHYGGRTQPSATRPCRGLSRRIPLEIHVIHSRLESPAARAQ